MMQNYGESEVTSTVKGKDCRAYSTDSRWLTDQTIRPIHLQSVQAEYVQLITSYNKLQPELTYG